MILAASDGFSLFLLLAVLGWLGRCLVQALERLKRRERFVYRAACTLGVLSGLAMFGMGLQSEASADAEVLLGLLIPAGFTGLISAFGWYFAVAVLLFVWEYGAALPFRVMGRLSRAQRERQERKRWEDLSQQESGRKTEEQARTMERQRQERSQQSGEQQRRDDARLECQLLYDRHAERLRGKFPRERLQEYFAAYMTDSHTADAVEQRAKLLQEMLREHLNADVAGARAFRSLVEVAAHFQQRRAELQALPYDQETRDTLLVSLNQHEERAIQEFLKR